MKKTKKALASLAIAGMALTMVPFNAFATGTVPTRLAGTTAAQTAVAIAEQTGWTGTAILASSESYGMVDALTAGPLASYLKAPILLTGAGNTLNADTKAELTKLNVNTVYVTSGTAVISQAVLDEIKNMNITVVPLGGFDRAATSVNIASKMVGVTKVAIANGIQDALSIAAIASAANEPILLTDKNELPASVTAFLTANPTITASDVIGGTGIISDTVKAALPNATRHAGITAYDTNNQVIQDFDSSITYSNIFVANGVTGIDALAGAPLAAQTKSAIVLTDGIAAAASTFVNGKASAGSVVTALGGTAVVPATVLAGVGFQAPSVKSVSAINKTTVAVTVGGSIGGKTISDADFSVAVGENDVQISKVEAGSAAGVFNLTIGATLSQGDTVTVKGAEDVSGSGTCVYSEYAVTKVDAVEATYDSTKADQKLGFKTNGATSTVEALVAQGYDVQFQADQAVFAAAATTSGNGILNKAQLELLVNLPTDVPAGLGEDSFKYKVVITKDGALVAESEQVEVKVFDGEKTSFTEIKSYELQQGAGLEKITSGKLVKGETANIEKVIANKLMDDRVDVDLTNLITVETSDPFVIGVTQPVAGGASAILAANGTGTSTITIKSGNVQKTFTVTVVSAARKVSSVASDVSTVKIAREGVKALTLTFKDQYGDVYEGAVDGTEFDVDATINNADDDLIANVTITTAPAATTVDGELDLEVKAPLAGDSGSGTLHIAKDTGSDMITIPVSVEADAIAKTYKLEASNADSKDKILDLNDQEIFETDGDHEIQLNVNQYTSAGSLIGPVLNANLSVDEAVATAAGAGNYYIRVVDNKGDGDVIADSGVGRTVTVAVVGDKYVITPNASAGRNYGRTGTYTAKVYDYNQTLINSTTFTVKDSAPVVSAATFVTAYEINAASPTIESLIPEANIKVTGAGGDGKVRVSPTGLVYIDVQDPALGTIGTYDPDQDIYLGDIVAAKKSGTIDAVSTLTVIGSNLDVTGVNDGIITIGIRKRGASTPTFVGNFKVKF